MSQDARILIIAGSDSSGGAGIQADIKTVTMLGGHAMTAITAVTAQNSGGVSAIHPIPTQMVLDQVSACVNDIGVDAVKIGMIGSADTAHALAAYLGANISVPIVLDPVMVATSGAVLADDDVVAAFAKLMDVATLTTPNIPELDALGGEEAVLRHATALLVKGGHAAGPTITDRLLSQDGETIWTDDRIDTRHAHGTGCTLGSAIALGLGEGMAMEQAITRARMFVRIALHAAPDYVARNGPMGFQDVRLDAPALGPALNQITLGCTDYARSCAFYRQLGLRQIVDAPPRYARFETAGGATFSLHQTDRVQAADTMVYFECLDLDALIEPLCDAGVLFDEPATDRSWGWREARLRDPDGHRLCLYFAGEMRRYPPWRMAS